MFSVEDIYFIKTIYFFDIDDTLFETTARRGVMKDGKVIKYLEKQNAFNYELQEGESFEPWKDGEFTDAKLFNDTSKPIKAHIDRLRKIVNHIPAHSKVVLLTARNRQNCTDTFLETFETHGIDTSRVMFMYADDFKNRHGGGYAAANKQMIVDMFLATGHYDRAVFVDDSIRNLVYFDALKLKHPDIEFISAQAKPDGELEFSGEIDHEQLKQKHPTAYDRPSLNTVP